MPPPDPASEKLCTEPLKTEPEKGSRTREVKRPETTPEYRLEVPERLDVIRLEWITILSLKVIEDEKRERIDKVVLMRWLDGIMLGVEVVSLASKTDRKESPARYFTSIESALKSNSSIDRSLHSQGPSKVTWTRSSVLSSPSNIRILPLEDVAMHLDESSLTSDISAS
jgi:hypothetical protein